VLFNDLPLFITTIATSTTVTVIIGDTIIRWISRVFSSVMWSLTTIIVIHMMTIIMTVMTTIVMEIRVVVVVDPLAFFRFELLLLLIIIK
jgi:hypothetical protein